MKLTEEDVLTIRTLYRQDIPVKAIALQFARYPTTISKIVYGVYAAKIGEPIEERHCKDCNALIDRHKKRCEPCRKAWKIIAYREWNRKRRASAKPGEEWLCVDCKTPVEDGIKRCDPCYKAHQDTYFPQRYRRLKAERQSEQREQAS